MDNLGDAAVHTRSILRPYGVFAVISPFNFPMALAVGPSGGGDDGRQHGRLQAGVRVGDDRRLRSSRPTATPACPTACSTWSWAPARRSAPSSRRTRASTASSSPARTRSASTSSATSPRVPAPVHRRDGRQEPGDRPAQRRPRGGGRGDHALGLRLRRPEVLREQPRLRRATGPRRAGPPAGREDREASTIGDPLRARTGWAPSSTSARSTATSRRSPRRAATARSSPAASGSPRRPRPAASTSSPRSSACPPSTASSRTSCSCRSRRSPPVDSLDEALALANDNVYGLTAGVY